MHCWKKLSLGFVLWLIPFVFGFLFFGPDGEMVIGETFFKSIMIVISSLTGVSLAVWYFKSVTRNFVKEGIMLGMSWLVVNWVVDALFVMVGFFDMGFGQYMTDIGLRYLSAPIYTIGLGVALRHLKNKETKKTETGQ